MSLKTSGDTYRLPLSTNVPSLLLPASGRTWPLTELRFPHMSFFIYLYTLIITVDGLEMAGDTKYPSRTTSQLRHSSTAGTLMDAQRAGVE